MPTHKTPLERLESLAERVAGRGAAVELRREKDGTWSGVVWRASGLALVATWQLGTTGARPTKAEVIAALRRYLERVATDEEHAS
jgi:hypothetical protein